MGCIDHEQRGGLIRRRWAARSVARSSALSWPTAIGTVCRRRRLTTLVDRTKLGWLSTGPRPCVVRLSKRRIASSGRHDRRYASRRTVRQASQHCRQGLDSPTTCRHARRCSGRIDRASAASIIQPSGRGMRYRLSTSKRHGRPQRSSDGSATAWLETSSDGARARARRAADDRETERRPCKGRNAQTKHVVREQTQSSDGQRSPRHDRLPVERSRHARREAREHDRMLSLSALRADDTQARRPCSRDVATPAIRQRAIRRAASPSHPGVSAGAQPYRSVCRKCDEGTKFDARTDLNSF